MATKYWVGGSGTWNLTDTSHWSDTSGGTPGASVPTKVDDVNFDELSSTGAFTVTISENVVCSSFAIGTTSAKVISVSGTNAGSINIYGTVFLTGYNTGISNFTNFAGYVNIYNNTCTLVGSTQVKYLAIKSGAVANIQFSVNTLTEKLIVEAGARATFRNSYTCGSLEFGPSIYNMDSARITLGWSSNTDVLLTVKTQIYGAGSVFSYNNVSTSYLVAAPNGSNMYISLGEKTSSNSYVRGTITKLVLQPNSSTNTFRFDVFPYVKTLTNNSSPCILEFSPSSVMNYFDYFDINGTSTTSTKIRSSVDGVRAKIGRLENIAGTVVTNYVEVRDMQPVKDNTWISYNSVNAGNNYQWYFDNFNKPTSSLFYGSHV